MISGEPGKKNYKVYVTQELNACRSDLMFWSDVQFQMINVAYFNGSNLTALVTTNITIPGENILTVLHTILCILNDCKTEHNDNNIMITLWISYTILVLVLCRLVLLGTGLTESSIGLMPMTKTSKSMISFISIGKSSFRLGQHPHPELLYWIQQTGK